MVPQRPKSRNGTFHWPGCVKVSIGRSCFFPALVFRPSVLDSVFSFPRWRRRILRPQQKGQIVPAFFLLFFCVEKNHMFVKVLVRGPLSEASTKPRALLPRPGARNSSTNPAQTNEMLELHGVPVQAKEMSIDIGPMQNESNKRAPGLPWKSDHGPCDVHGHRPCTPCVRDNHATTIHNSTNTHAYTQTNTINHNLVCSAIHFCGPRMCCNPLLQSASWRSTVCKARCELMHATMLAAMLHVANASAVMHVSAANVILRRSLSTWAETDT